jgi:hypothetical protein
MQDLKVLAADISKLQRERTASKSIGALGIEPCLFQAGFFVCVTCWYLQLPTKW